VLLVLAQQQLVLEFQQPVLALQPLVQLQELALMHQHYPQ
jgi:hypothetical protein